MDVTKLKDELRRDEGLRLKPYKCTAGKLTIGIGRNLDDRGISEDEAECLLENDIQGTINEVASAFPFFDNLTDARQRALVNMAFNIGVPRLRGFRRMIAAMAECRWDDAAAEALNSLWAKQVGARAQRIAQMIREG